MAYGSTAVSRTPAGPMASHPPRPNVRLADLMTPPDHDQIADLPVRTPRRLRLAVEWLLRSRVLWRVK